MILINLVIDIEICTDMVLMEYLEVTLRLVEAVSLHVIIIVMMRIAQS